MNTRNLLSLLLAVAFVGFTSCGDDQAAKDAQIQRLQAQLAAQRAANAANATPVVVYTTQTNTSVVVSSTTSVVGSSTNYSTGTYTVTGTVSSTATGSAYRE